MVARLDVLDSFAVARKTIFVVQICECEECENRDDATFSVDGFNEEEDEDDEWIVIMITFILSVPYSAFNIVKWIVPSIYPTDI